MTVCVYVLVDPRDGVIRYVGRTVDPRKRFDGHIFSRHFSGAKSRWVRELAALNMKPHMEIVALCSSPYDAADIETAWIAENRATALNRHIHTVVTSFRTPRGEVYR